MDQIEDVSADLVHVKNEQCIVVRTRDGKNVLTNPVGLIVSCALMLIHLQLWSLLSVVCSKNVLT